jgi:hypothetical protein
LDHVCAGIPVNEVSSIGQFLTPAQVYKLFFANYSLKMFENVTVMQYKHFSREKKIFYFWHKNYTNYTFCDISSKIYTLCTGSVAGCYITSRDSASDVCITLAHLAKQILGQ